MDDHIQLRLHLESRININFYSRNLCQIPYSVYFIFCLSLVVVIVGGLQSKFKMVYSNKEFSLHFCYEIHTSFKLKDYFIYFKNLLPLIFATIWSLTQLILGTRKISVLRKECTVSYHIGTLKNCASVNLRICFILWKYGLC